MKARHRGTFGGVLLLAVSLTLAAEPARASSLRQERPALSRAFDWLSLWWQGGVAEGTVLSHLLGRQGLGADPDGKATPFLTSPAGSGSLSSTWGKEGAGSDPNGTPHASSRTQISPTGDAGAGSDPNGGH
jgi:hypothetical protein